MSLPLLRDATERAYLDALAAADALDGIDDRMAMLIRADDGTADAHALATGAAFAHDGHAVTRTVDEAARAVEHEHRELVVRGGRALGRP